MWKKEYRRYMRSKSSFVILFLLIPVLMSFFISLQDKNMFQQQLSNPSSDISLQALTELVAQYTGMSFIFDFFFVSDFFLLYMVILFVWMGAFLCSLIQIQQTNGFGNYLIVRSSYPYYIKQIFIAQSLYIATIVLITHLVMYLLAGVLAGFQVENYSIGLYDLDHLGSAALFLLQTGWITLVCLIINGIGLTINIWIKNQYVIQAFPFVGFVVLPMIIISTIGNIFPDLGAVIVYMDAWTVMRALENMVQEQFAMIEIFKITLPMMIYTLLCVLLYKIHVNRFRREYL